MLVRFTEFDSCHLLRAEPCGGPFCAIARLDGRDVNQMLGDEPHLEFFGRNQFAGKQVVGPLVSRFVCCLGCPVSSASARFPWALISQGKLHLHALATARRMLNPGHRGHICCHRDTYAAQELNSFG